MSPRQPQNTPPPGRKMTPRLAMVPREDPTAPTEAERTPVPTGDELVAMPERERWALVSAHLKEGREHRTQTDASIARIEGAVASEGKATRDAIGELSGQIGLLAASDAGHVAAIGKLTPKEAAAIAAPVAKEAARDTGRKVGGYAAIATTAAVLVPPLFKLIVEALGG